MSLDLQNNLSYILSLFLYNHKDYLGLYNFTPKNDDHNVLYKERDTTFCDFNE